jgi:hypothetical protein
MTGPRSQGNNRKLTGSTSTPNDLLPYSSYALVSLPFRAGGTLTNRRMSRAAVRSITACLALTTCIALCACQPRTFLSNEDWCSDVKTQLQDAEVGWPIANRSLNAEQIDSVESIFERYAPRATGDLNISASGWLQGYTAAVPHLKTGDQEAFHQEVPEELRRQLHLANVTVSRICKWEDW